MKVAYDKITTVIEINTDQIAGLVVENERMLYQLLIDLRRALEGEESGIIISKEERPISIPKTVALVTDFVNFTLNQKSLLTKIVGELEKISKNEMFYQESQKVLAYIEQYILGLTMDFPCELSCEKISMQNLLKSVGIVITDNYDSLEERLLAYMDLEREYEAKELFVFVNLRCFIPAENAHVR